MIRLGKGVGLVLQKREEAGAASAFPYSIPAECGSGGMEAEKEARESAAREGKARREVGERRVIGRGKGKLVCFHIRVNSWVRIVRPQPLEEQPRWLTGVAGAGQVSIVAQVRIAAQVG